MCNYPHYLVEFSQTKPREGKRLRRLPCRLTSTRRGGELSRSVQLQTTPEIRQVNTATAASFILPSFPDIVNLKEELGFDLKKHLNETRKNYKHLVGK